MTKKLLLAILLGAAGLAQGGARFGQPVEVYTISNSATGNITDARSSADGTQYIGCDVFNYPSGNSLISCFARSAYGYTGSCMVVNAPQNMIDAVMSISPRSTLTFTWDSAGSCTVLRVRHASYSGGMQ